LQIKTKIVSCHIADSKPVKQEVNGTVILPPLVFTGAYFDLNQIEQHALKIVNNCLNTNIYSYLEISSGYSSNLYLNVVHFLTPVLIRCLWQLNTAALLQLLCCIGVLYVLLYWCHWCLPHLAKNGTFW
jgi:hypothetical protein